MSIIKEEKNIETEIVEKRGKVINAQEIFDKNDEVRTKQFRDFGQIDFEDHEIEETEKRDKKINKDLDNVKNKETIYKTNIYLNQL